MPERDAILDDEELVKTGNLRCRYGPCMFRDDWNHESCIRMTSRHDRSRQAFIRVTSLCGTPPYLEESRCHDTSWIAPASRDFGSSPSALSAELRVA